MARLNDLRIRSLKPSLSERWISDGNGLYLRLRGDGASKVWFFRYTKNGKTKKLQLGPYPETGLAEARIKTLELAKEHRSGLDPIEERKRRQEEELRKVAERL